MTEFWEAAFKDKKEMWGFEPAKSAILAKDFFLEQKVKTVLIPGIGYGRNANIFLKNGMVVTGIEISQTAINLAKNHYDDHLTIYHGSVTEMPFDKALYDGVFCYALIHLLDEKERIKLISDCYNQLSDNGVMIFTTITQKAATYGQGTPIGKDRFELFGGVQMFFYDVDTIKKEFGASGLVEIRAVEENYPFYLIICKKAGSKTS